MRAENCGDMAPATATVTGAERGVGPGGPGVGTREEPDTPGAVEEHEASEEPATAVETPFAADAGLLADVDVARMHNMVSTAIQFGIGLMITILMILVVGLFVVNVPTSGAFSGTLETAQDIGGAGFVIMVVSLLVVPVVGLVAYFAGSGLMQFTGPRRGR